MDDKLEVIISISSRVRPYIRSKFCHIVVGYTVVMDSYMKKISHRIDVRIIVHIRHTLSRVKTYVHIHYTRPCDNCKDQNVSVTRCSVA